MMFPDCHLHTSFSGDSDTPPEEQIKKAVSLGMNTICFTDHHDHDVVSDIDFELDIPAYMDEMKRLKEKYSGSIEILCGIELGLQNRIADYLDELTEKYSFDYVIGSVHFVDGLDPYYPEYFEKYGKDSYRLFFETTLRRIQRIKCYDSLGHLDYIVRYGAKHGMTYSYAEYSDIIDTILRQLIDDGKALECNTGGLSRGLSEPNPCTDVLKRYRELGGILVTMGSDAHTPETLGCKFNECSELLKRCGFEYAAVYRERTPQMIKL